MSNQTPDHSTSPGFFGQQNIFHGQEKGVV